MQPSLQNVLTPKRTEHIISLGWTRDPAFGNFVKTFAAREPTSRIAEQIRQALTDAYDAKTSALSVSTRWVVDTPCPPRAGYTQNLAGSVNDATSMRGHLVHACSFTPPRPRPQIASGDVGQSITGTATAAALIKRFGASVSAEIQRLRINVMQRQWFVLQPEVGYVQCITAPKLAAIDCEAQSVQSRPALAAFLTSHRIDRLRALGYADPGRSANHLKTYPLATYTDAAIARELLTVLAEIYQYSGTTDLKLKTEQRILTTLH